MQEPTHSVPQSTAGQALLVPHTRTLRVLRQSSHNLFGHFECLEEVLPPLEVDDGAVRIVPVEVRDGLLQPQEVVHSADHDVDCGGVARLCAQVVLEGLVVPLTQELEESKQRGDEGGLREHLAHSCGGWGTCTV